MSIDNENVSTDTDVVDNNTSIEKPADVSASDDFYKSFIDNDPDSKNLFKPQSTDDDKQGTDADPLDPEDDSTLEGKDNSGTQDLDDSKKEDDTEEEDSGKPSDGEKVEYEDNVIEGLKGDDFAKLTDEGKVAVSNLLEKSESLERDLSAARETLSKYDQDPIIKNRLEMLQRGQDLYKVEGLTATESEAIKNYFKEEFGLNDTEAEKAFNAVKSGIEQVAESRANAIANNIQLQSETKRKETETIQKGREVFLGLKEFNKSLELKETDLNKFYKGISPDGTPIYNETHPEINQFRNGVEKIMKYCASIGIDYEKVIKMGSKQVYALAAVALNLPVAFNTKERDSKIVMEQTQKRLQRFLKAGTGTLSIDSNTSAADRNSVLKTHIDGGFDLEKLATDQEYLEKAYNAKPMWDTAHREKVDRLFEKGLSIVKQRSKKK